jgi:hypothetical protein
MRSTNTVTPSAWDLAGRAMSDPAYVDGLHFDRETQVEWIDADDVYLAAQNAVAEVEGWDEDERRDRLSDVLDCLREELHARKIEVRD